jgi:thiol-disulfide isomerase/thioredoxin
MKRRFLLPAFLALVTLAPASVRATQPDAEARVIDYIRQHLHAGEPLRVTELSKALTQPDEQKALGKLYSAFFRIPLFVAEYQEKFGSPPSLKVISEQFDLRAPQAAEVLLKVMESDPRVPRFLTRDRASGEILRVDVEKIRSDPRFGQALARQLTGWEGKTAPNFTLAKLEGGEVSSESLGSKVALLYVWFTGCPPCMKETPVLVALQQEFSARGLVIVGANADRVLGLGYDDTVRQRYVRENKVNFPIVHWTQETDKAWGSISIFPTLFLINRKGAITRHWIGFVSKDELGQAIARDLESGGPPP